MKADWDHWTDIPQAQLWEVVALSLDYQPDRLPGVEHRPAWGDIFDDCPEEYRKRLEKAERCVEARTVVADRKLSHL